MYDASPERSLPSLPGVGYKPQHFADIFTNPAPVGWFKIHADNYMGDGGQPLAQSNALAKRFPISMHGVGLSIGGEGRGLIAPRGRTSSISGRSGSWG
mgnify:CR=1 FL=1